MISRTQLNKILRVYKTQKTYRIFSKDSGTSVGSEKDRVKLSFSAKDVERVKELVQKMPDIRYEKVKDIAEKVATGSYSVDPKDVADKMLARLFADRIR